LFDELAEILSGDSWLSTQSTAYALLSCTRMAIQAGSKENFSYALNLNNKKENVNPQKLVNLHTIDVKLNPKGKIEILNQGKGFLYVTLINSGVPLHSEMKAAASHLEMEVNYYDLNGRSLDPKSMKQGSDFIAEVRVSHPGLRQAYSEMALHQLFPAGWEIRNIRMEEGRQLEGADIPRYQDIRDDRVYTYFNLEKGETKVFRIMLNAAYAGKYYLPAVYCEAMYDNKIYALKPGGLVEVVR
jgi:alpha-2-macroglobulin